MQWRDGGGRNVRRFLPLIVAVCALFSSATAGAAETVRVQLKWKHQFQFAGYYAAIAQGYYRDAGFDVRLIEPEEDTDPVAEVVEGRADYGIGTSELLLARAHGAPIVALAAIFQHSPLVLLARRDQPGESLHDLIGARVMMETQSAELIAYLKRENIPLDRLHIVPHAVDLAEIREGRVKALSAYSTDEPFALAQAGVPFSTFSPRSAGIDFYGDTLFTSEATHRQHPARVAAFVEATRRGWLHALGNVEETVDLILATYSRRHSREHLLYEAAAVRRLVLPDVVEIGYMHPGRWRHIADVYAEVGMMPAHFNLDRFIVDGRSTDHPRWVFFGLLGVLAAAAAAALVALRLRRLNAALAREIREREAAQRVAEAASSAKSEYLASMSHELRTPLNAILGFSETIEREIFGPAPARYREYAGDIRRSGEHLLAIVNDLLDLSKIEAGHMELDQEPVDAAALMEECRELLAPIADRRRQALVLAIETRPIVVADPLRLRQVIMNLVSNALKFAPLGGTVTMTVGRDGTDALLSVADDGVGMSADEIEVALQPFRQVGGGEGTGLGLPLAVRLTELQGGRLRVDSAPGRGTIVQAQLPAADGAAG